MKYILGSLMLVCAMHSAIAMDTEPSILQDLQGRIYQIIETGGVPEDLTPDDFETLDWFQWDGNPIACYLANKLMENTVKNG